jgi:potassium/hydrogen antiporter
MNTDFVYLALWAAGTLVFISVVAGLYSTRAGLSFLLVFLVAGMLAGEDGLGGLAFDDHRLVFWVGNAALAIILLDGGLQTTVATFRTGLKPALVLATVGVVLTAGLTGAAAMWLLDVDWRVGLLAGAVVGSTDAAAVFSLMRSAGLRLSERLASTLEIESGLNDPMAVVLTLMLIGAVEAAVSTSPAIMLLLQAGFGLAGGLGAGFAMAALLRRLPLVGTQRGLAALVLASSGLAVFAGVSLFGGSGFLAVYLFGLVVRARAERRVQVALSAMDGYAWLAQASMFLLLGLLVSPSRLWPTLVPALGVAAVLMFVARPLAVWLCLAPLRFTPREITFVSWVGLRGAVPIVLAVFPIIAGVPGAVRLLDVAFVVVLASLLLQGSTLGWAAGRLGVNLPRADDEPAQRATYGDFVVDPEAPADALFAFYGLDPPAPAGLSVAAWFQAVLHRPPVVGDTVVHGAARFSVRGMDGARITAIGLQLTLPAAGDD